jgi:hypothetical protein
MSPSRTVQRSVTPDSVKALMIIEAIVIAFFSFWLANEYVYNAFFRVYVNSVFVEHFTTYTIALGLGIGLAGTAAAAALYKNLREAKAKLESVSPRIRGSIEKMLAGVPGLEGKSANYLHPCSLGVSSAAFGREEIISLGFLAEFCGELCQQFLLATRESRWNLNIDSYKLISAAPSSDSREALAF